MAKKIVGISLVGVSVVLLIISIVMCFVSGALIDDIEDMEGDVSMSADFIRGTVDMMCDMYDENMGIELSRTEMIEQNMYVDTNGFAVFCLYARGWFWLLTVIFAVAGLLLLAIGQDPSIIGDAWELAKRIGLGVAGAITALLAAAKPVKKPVTAVYSCPGCGAPYGANTAFCSNCGTKLPDPSTIGLCPDCGTRNDPGARFCVACGKALH